MKNKVILIIALCLLILVNNSTYAQTYLNQDNDGQTYTVQSNDWLSKLADKFYSNIHAWPHIWIATNKKAIEDSTYSTITNPDFIAVGQKLWIPPPSEVEQVTLVNNELKTSIIIDARQGWQTTGLFINENTTLSLEVTDGQWTYWPNHAPYNAGEGGAYICAQVIAADQCVEPLPEFPAGGLIGRIGEEIFGIGRGPVHMVQQTGMLGLRINDVGLYDNVGELRVTLTMSYP